MTKPPPLFFHPAASPRRCPDPASLSSFHHLLFDELLRRGMEPSDVPAGSPTQPRRATFPILNGRLLLTPALVYGRETKLLGDFAAGQLPPAFRGMKRGCENAAQHGLCTDVPARSRARAAGAHSLLDQWGWGRLPFVELRLPQRRTLPGATRRVALGRHQGGRLLVQSHARAQCPLWIAGGAQC